MTARATLEPTAGPRPAADTAADTAAELGAEASRAFPFTASSAAFTVFFGWFGFGAGNVDAMIKSRTILARGVRALDNALFGVALMSVEHAAAAAKQVSDCGTLADGVDVRNCLFKLGVGRMVATTCMLSNMAVQVAEDASVPLTRRMSAIVAECATTSAA